MLQQETTQTTQSAALTRVGADELARAIAAIEERRHAGPEGDLDTIALGEAIRQLGLDITPEELLAEISRQRVAAEHAEAEEVATHGSWQLDIGLFARILTTAGAFLVLFWVFMAWLAEQHGPYWQYEPFTAIVVALYTFVAAWLSSRRARRRLFREPLTVGDAVTWNRKVRVSLSTVLAIARGCSPSVVLLDSDELRRWHVVPLHGMPAVQCWTDGRMVDGKLHVCSSRPVGQRSARSAYRPIAVAMSRFRDAPDPTGIEQSPLYAQGIEEAYVQAG